MSFAGLTVVSLESRRAGLVENLVRGEGGICFNAPSVRELPLEENHSCLELVRDLVSDKYEALVLTTGVGLSYLIDAAKSIGLEAELLEALRRVKTISRGPKPAAVLRDRGIKPTINVPEPNTWREIVDGIKPLSVKTVAVQEYGVSNPEFVLQLEAQGMQVTAAPVYRWALPEDLAPMRQAAQMVASGSCDIALFLSSVQLTHLLEVSESLGVRDLVLNRLRGSVVVASIGPVMTEALAKHDIEPDFSPGHPKLAICIRQLATEAQSLVAQKRGRAR
jgi:uroporphyrinogen-III synthase